MEPSAQQPIAEWNPARDVWETQMAGLFCEHSDVFSETWPTSGSMRNGTVYESPTSADATDAGACSSWRGLPTPRTRDYKDSQIRREPHRPNDTDTLSRALADLI